MRHATEATSRREVRLHNEVHALIEESPIVCLPVDDQRTRHRRRIVHRTMQSPAVAFALIVDAKNDRAVALTFDPFPQRGQVRHGHA